MYQNIKFPLCDLHLRINVHNTSELKKFVRNFYKKKKRFRFKGDVGCTPNINKFMIDTRIEIFHLTRVLSTKDSVTFKSKASSKYK